MFRLKNDYLRDFVSLFYPPYCYICGQMLVKNEKIICTRCALHLPYTDFHTYTPNPMEKLFWGRVSFESAIALFYFRKGGGVQTLIHQLKYKGHREIGVELGRILGLKMAVHPVLSTVDLLVPVPLHPKRRRSRGYNQSEAIAEGIASVLHKPVRVNALRRVIANATQTKRSLCERWENVSHIFSLGKADGLENCHLLLVDDVLTTGATVEAAAQVLCVLPGVRLSVVTLAFDLV